jgi:hypothetical protein
MGLRDAAGLGLFEDHDVPKAMIFPVAAKGQELGIRRAGAAGRD